MVRKYGHHWCNIFRIGNTQGFCQPRCTAHDTRQDLEPQQTRLSLEPLDAVADTHWTRQRAEWAGLDIEGNVSTGQHRAECRWHSVRQHAPQLFIFERLTVRKQRPRYAIFRFHRVSLVRGVYFQLSDIASKADDRVSYSGYELLAAGKIPGYNASNHMATAVDLPAQARCLCCTRIKVCCFSKVYLVYSRVIARHANAFFADGDICFGFG